MAVNLDALTDTLGHGLVDESLRYGRHSLWSAGVDSVDVDKLLNQHYVPRHSVWHMQPHHVDVAYIIEANYQGRHRDDSEDRTYAIGR